MNWYIIWNPACNNYFIDSIFKKKIGLNYVISVFNPLCTSLYFRSVEMNLFVTFVVMQVVTNKSLVYSRQVLYYV